MELFNSHGVVYANEFNLLVHVIAVLVGACNNMTGSTSRLDASPQGPVSFYNALSFRNRKLSRHRF